MPSKHGVAGSSPAEGDLLSSAVEHLAFNQVVVGSSPTGGAVLIRDVSNSMNEYRPA